MMENTNDIKRDLSYVRSVLEKADKGGSYPMIFVMWGVIVFLGFVVAEFLPNSLLLFWCTFTPLGMIASIYLGIRQDRSSGQSNVNKGKLYTKHIGLMVVFIFTAMFTGNNLAILLLLGLTYSLAGLYLDRNMLYVGILSWLVYLGAFFEILQSNLLVGVIFAAGFFIVAYGMTKDQKSVMV